MTYPSGWPCTGYEKDMQCKKKKKVKQYICVYMFFFRAKTHDRYGDRSSRIKKRRFRGKRWQRTREKRPGAKTYSSRWRLGLGSMFRRACGKFSYHWTTKLRWSGILWASLGIFHAKRRNRYGWDMLCLCARQLIKVDSKKCPLLTVLLLIYNSFNEAKILHFIWPRLD